MKRNIPRILIDTREQDGFLFEGYEAQCTSEKLDAGDYTIVGHDMAGDDHSIIIERKKNCSELIGNVGTNWERFLREAEQLAKYKTKLIVVTAPCNFEFLYNNQLTRLHPNFVYKQLSYLQINYGISTLFFPTKEIAENYVFRLFIETLRLTEEDYV